MSTQNTPEPVYCRHGLCHHHCSDCREEYVFALRQQRDEAVVKALYMAERFVDAEQQRDELLAEMKRAKGTLGGIFNYTQDGKIACACADAIDAIDKTITKAKGQQI